MFFPWGRAITPFSLRGTYGGLSDNTNRRGGLVLSLALAEDTTITLRAGSVLILPAVAALVEKLPHDRIGELITIEYGGEVARPGPRPDGRPGTALRHLFSVEPGVGGAPMIVLRP